MILAHQYKSHSRSHRLGIAQLEFVLMFPLLVFLIATFFLLMSAAVTRMETANQSRQNTFKARYAEETSESDTSESLNISSCEPVKQIFADGSAPRQQEGDAVITGSDAKKADPILDVFEGVLGVAKVENHVMFDPWDHRALPFEKHDRLTIDKRAMAFGPSRSELRSFKQLASATSDSQHDGNTRRERRLATQSQDKASEGLESAQAQLAALIARLEHLRGQDPVDWRAVLGTELQIDELETVIDGLQAAAEWLETPLPVSGE